MGWGRLRHEALTEGTATWRWSLPWAFLARGRTQAVLSDRGRGDSMTEHYRPREGGEQACSLDRHRAGQLRGLQMTRELCQSEAVACV